MIRHFCPNCHKKNESSDHLAGLERPCHYCGEPVTVPSESAPLPKRVDIGDDPQSAPLTPPQGAVKCIAGIFGGITLVAMIVALSGALGGGSLGDFAFAGLLLALAGAAAVVSIQLWRFRPEARMWGVAVAGLFLLVQIGVGIFFRDDSNVGLLIFNALILTLLLAALMSRFVGQAFMPPEPATPMASEKLHELLSKH